MKHPLKSVLLAIVGWLTASASMAASICWIEDVQKSGNNVKVTFVSTGSFQITVADPPYAGPRKRCLSRNGKITCDGDAEHEWLLLSNAQKAFVSQSHHDGCELLVVAGPEKTGIQAEAHLQLPGIPASTAREFIPAKNQ